MSLSINIDNEMNREYGGVYGFFETPSPTPQSPESYIEEDVSDSVREKLNEMNAPFAGEEESLQNRMVSVEPSVTCLTEEDEISLSDELENLVPMMQVPDPIKELYPYFIIGLIAILLALFMVL